MESIVHPASPRGILISQTLAMPAYTNVNGDIFGGWLLSQMDLASAILAGRVAKGRVATVAISSMSFIRPVPVGAIVGCYAELVKTGNTSLTIHSEVWISSRVDDDCEKVTEGEFVFVAIDDDGNKRRVSA